MPASEVVATARWRALDREGEDICRLSRTDAGWLLVGHARFRDGDGSAALDYVIRCNLAWRTLSADVAGLHQGLEVNLRVLCKGGNWTLNDEAQPQVDGATDIDLSFTPATNLMPLRRLADIEARMLPVRAAWLRYPQAELAPLDQTYRQTGLTDIVAYSAEQTGFSTRFGVDPSGFVTFYPDHWEGEVSHAD